LDIFHNLALGFATSLLPYNLMYGFLGALLGTLIGVLPGVGPLATIALLLPLTMSLPPETALIMLAGIYYGAQYGGSTTAILMNLPGESSSVVTTLDGYQMARQGRAGVALTTAAVGSFVAGSFATLMIALLSPPLTVVALSFGAPENFSLIVLGLILSVALSHGSVIKGVAMSLLGVLLGLIGQDIYTGLDRFTMGLLDLQDGVDIVPIAIGLFGIAEILRNLGDGQARSVLTNPITSLFPTREDVRRIIGPILRGTFIGSVLGILPGGGAMLSSFASYTVEKRVARDSGSFGRGAIEGVAGPESANNAGAQMSFIPMLTLGLPSNPVMALMIGALIMQGITPGPNVAVTRPEIFWGLITSMWVGNIMLLVLNLPLVGIWVKLLRIPYNVLVPAILALSVIGVYSINFSGFSVLTIAAFGAMGYVLTTLDCEPAPLMLGFILGPMLEEHLRRSMLLSRGSPWIFLEHPISAGLLLLALLVLLAVLLPWLKNKRQEVFVESEA
jgi:TctA family transporter